MALKRLTTSEMLQVTGPWVEPTSKARTALLGKPLFAALVPQIDLAHAGLLAAQGTPEDRLVFNPLRDAEKTADRRTKAPAEPVAKPAPPNPGI